MNRRDNHKSTNDKQRCIPMEVTSETIRDFNIREEDISWTKINNRLVRVILVPATEEQYRAYMRPLWRIDKGKKRHGDHDSFECLMEENYIKLPCSDDVASIVIKKELIEALHKAIDTLDETNRMIMMMFANGSSEAEIGRLIGMSQKGVNKRKKKIFEKLREHLKDFV